MAMPVLKIGDLTARLPIVQGGMAVGLSLSGLASAVANEGGIGILAAPAIGMSEPDFYKNYIEANTRALRKEIQRARELTDGILGVNIMVPLTNFRELVEAAVDEGIDIIFAGGALPMKLAEIMVELRNKSVKLVPIVSSVRALQLICRSWSRVGRSPDAVVVEGPLAGGHLGFSEEEVNDPEITLEKIIKSVRTEINENWPDIPVIAAGGIYTGEDIKKFLNLGASGVQMGTRFITTEECEAPVEFKQAYLDAKEEDIVLIKSPLGLMGRAIQNDFLREVKEGKRHPGKCKYNCIKDCAQENAPYCIFWALTNAKQGKLKSGFAFAGANAWRATEIVTVHELMTELMREYEEAT